MAEFIESNRGKPLLVLDCYKFSIGSVNKKTNSTRWRCIRRDCDAKVFTVNKIVVQDHRENLSHRHKPYDRNTISRQIVSSACKRKAVDAPSVRPKTIILKEVGENIESSQFTTTDIKRIRKNVYDARRKVLPSCPTSLEEVHSSLEKMDIKTKQGEPFLLVNDTEKNIIIFSCTSNILFLKEIETLYMDGTFKYSARFFTQMFTIHGLKNGNYIPLIFCLLPNKTTETYIHAFHLILQKCTSLGVTLLPQYVTTDYEKAIINAVHEIWPQTQIIGCRFHLTQAWYRQIQKVGLATEYQDRSSEIGLWLRHTFGLLFLEPNNVLDCFLQNFMADRPIDDKVIKYADYLIDNYLTDDCDYPPEIWASASSSLQRTTNNCESFHANFNRSFYKESPSIFNLLAVLIDEVQTEIYIKLRSVHLPNRTQDRSIRERKSKNEKYISDYQNGQLDRYLQYIIY